MLRPWRSLTAARSWSFIVLNVEMRTDLSDTSVSSSRATCEGSRGCGQDWGAGEGAGAHLGRVAARGDEARVVSREGPGAARRLAAGRAVLAQARVEAAREHATATKRRRGAYAGRRAKWRQR